MKTVTIKGVEIGQGLPKIVVPIIGQTESQLLHEVEVLKNIDFDVLEWRSDHFHAIDNIDKVISIAQKLTKALPKTPILFTFRSANEGGAKAITKDDYIKLNKALIASRSIDLIDVELFTGDALVQDLIDNAHANQVAVIVSNHDFVKTPTKEIIINRLCKMQQLGADIAKIAVMPQSTTDVLTLLAATAEMTDKHAHSPIVTMSMSALGAISRIAGETFGSAMTFGTAQHSSAPGQLEVTALRQILQSLHQQKN
jgi:3-dehydroquinate dehydratase I